MKKTLLFVVLFLSIFILKAQWVDQTSPTQNSLFSIHFPSSDVGYIVGYQGKILKTVDGGNNWGTQTSPVTETLWSVHFPTVNAGYAVGANGVIIKTVNGGVNWAPKTSGTTTELYSVFFTSYDIGYAVGGSGLILKTVDGGGHWIAQTSGTIRTLISVHFPTVNVGYAVGENGTILKTVNGGDTWVLQASGISSWIRSVYFTTVDIGYAVGVDGVIMKTVDGGNNWIHQTYGTTTFLSVYFPTSDIGYAVGTDGAIFATMNGGDSWYVQDSGTQVDLRSVCFTDVNTGYIAGINGTILKTETGGWCTGVPGKPSGATQICSPSDAYNYITSGAPLSPTSYMWSINPPEAGTVTGTGTNVTVVWSTTYDGVASLSVGGVNPDCMGESSFVDITINNSIESPGDFDLISPQNGTWVSATPLFQWSASTEAQSYNLYIDGILFKENITETYYQIETDEALTNGTHTWHVIAKNSSDCEMVSGEIRNIQVDTTISPQSVPWFSRMSATLEHLNSIHFPSSDIGYIVGESGMILKTQNGGNSWYWQTSGQTEALHSVHFPTVNAGYAVGANGVIIKTVNGGVNWAPKTSGTTTWLYSVFFTSYDTGYAVGGSGLILKTVDGGGHWVAQTSGTTRTLFSVHFPTVNVGYAVGEQGTILKTVNGGDTWVPQASGISSWIRSVYFTTVDIGYAVGLGGEILKTIDGGNNWILQNFENISFYSVCFPSVNIGYAVGYNGVILKTEDGGTSWTPQTSGTTKHLRSVYFPSVDDGCVVGIQGTILKTTTGGWCTGFPGKPSGITQICSPSSTYNYTTSGAPFSPTSYMWSINPPEAGTVTGTDTIATVVWSTTYDGIASLRVQGIKEDCVGESSSIEVVINSSNNYPGEFDLISPQNEEWVSSTPLFQWSASTGAQSYNLYIYGVLFKENITETFYQVEADEALTNGTIMWRVVANNGCTTPSNEICTLYVDLNPPAVFSLISPVDNATVSTSRPTFKWNESVDTGSGIDKYQLHISGQEPVDIASSETEYLLTFDLPYGTYTWFVRAYDVVGNFTNSNTHNFTVESPYPDIAETPTGENQLCINPINTNYTTTGTTNATSYIWHINPATAGTITGTGLTATVDWNDTFTGEANISVQGVNDEGVGPLSNPYIVTISPATAPGFVAGSITICLGETTGMLTLTNYMGTILKWQKRYNGGVWEDIVMTPSPYSAIYYETPTMSGEWQYRAEVQSGACTAEYSAEATIIVIDVPVAGNVITGDETVCQGQTAVTYTVPVIANATSYVWTLPPDATGSSTTNSITIDFGLTAASGYIRVKGVNSCGEGETSQMLITVNPLPVAEGSISALTGGIICQGDTVTYSIPEIPNATSYIWTLPDGATGTSSTNSITVNFSTTAVSGDITVRGVNSCGEGVAITKTIIVHPLPADAGAISGPDVVCQGDAVIYSIPEIAHATYYKWTFPDGTTSETFSNSITVNFYTISASGNITVRGVNHCGEGANSTKFITVNLLPAAAGPISGPTTVYPGQTSITYSVPEIANATSYTWTLPTGATGTSSTNSITVDYNMTAVPGNITVRGVNSCGEGAVSTKTINVDGFPGSTGPISGPSSVCQGQDSVTYSVESSVNTTSYIWTLPNGVTGTSTTNSITVNFSTTAVSGDITVRGVNSNGEGPITTKTVHVNELPATAGPILGPDTVCQGGSVLYTVLNFPNATSYIWTLPDGATGTSSTNSITVNFSTTAVSGNIIVQGVNECGVSAVITKLVTIKPLPDAAGTISGDLTVCPREIGVIYTVPPIPNATSYVWTSPPGISGTDSANSITVNVAIYSVSGYISVKGVNSCGEGQTSQMVIYVNQLPAAAGTIYGRTEVCQGETSITYYVLHVNYATSYIWTLPDGATGTSSTNSITVDYSMTAVSGDITVRGVNSYGEGAVSTQAITVNQFPAAAGIISGPDTVCQGDTVIYSVPEIALATSYYWTLPGTGSDVTETNSITVIYGMGMSSGNLSVKGSNYCGRGTASFKPITVNPLPVAVGIISASKLGTVCQGDNNVVYTVPTIAYASYVWTLPTGATGSSTTNSITVNYGTTAVSGNITVKGVNSCGEGVVSTKAITVNPLPSAAGTISGNATVCQGESGVVYTVPEITNATSYVWTLPTGATGSSTTNSITVDFGNTAISGDITVQGLNSCGEGDVSTLTITVNNNTTSTISVTVCDSYTAPDGQVYTTSGTETAVIPNTAGCDSIITINLLVNYTPPTPTIVLNDDRLVSSSVTGNQWYNQDGIMPNETNQELILTANGTYYVIVTENDCPSEQSNSILVDNVIVQEYDKNLILISPNPFADLLTIKNQSSETYQFTMYNGIGQIVFKGILETEITLNTSALTNGLYIIKFVDNSGDIYYKVIKQ